MSYTIIKTDGNVLTTITDGTLDNTSTPLGLPGRNFPSYGQIVNTNFIRALENFANTAPPANAMVGQLWFDSASEVLHICPTAGETNPANWIPILNRNDVGNLTVDNLTANANVSAQIVNVTDQLNADDIVANNITALVSANLAQSNIGNLSANLVTTANITSGSTSTLGNITGAWTINGAATINAVPNTSLFVTGGNVVISGPSSAGIRTDNYMWANGDPVSFSGTYSNANVQTFLPTFVGNVGAPGSSTTFNGRLLSTGANSTTGTITGAWTLSAGSVINGISNVAGANVTGTVANATAAVTAQSATTAGTVTTGPQPNITSVGTLTALTVSGNAQFTGTTVNLGNIANLRIAGGAAGQVLSTNGSGVLSWQSSAAADTAITVTANAQPNITSVGTLSSLGVSGNLTAGNITTGGVFTGNGAGLTNVPVSSLVGTFPPVTSANTANTANTAITVTANAQPNITSVGTLTSLTVSGTITAGNLTASLGNVTANRIAGTIITSNQPNITTLGTLASLTVSGNVDFSGTVVDIGTVANLRIFGGTSGQVLTSQGGGQVAWQTGISANTAVTVTANAQPNITSVGTLTNLVVTGNITAANITANTRFTGNAAGLTNIPGANVFGTVPESTTAVRASTVTANAQPNITSVGTLTSLSVTGNVTAGNVSATSVSGNGAGISSINASNISTGTVPSARLTGTYNIDISGNANTANTATTAVNATNATNADNAVNASNAVSAQRAITVTANAQPNITSLGTLTSLGVNGNIIASNITANTGSFTGSGSGLTNINASNISTGILPAGRLSGSYTIDINGSATSATTAVSATNAINADNAVNAGNAVVAQRAGTVTTNAQPNITSLGTLTSLSVTGNVTAGNVSATSVSGNGAGISSINASNISTGTLPTGRLSGTYTININGTATSATSATNATNATNADNAVNASNAVSAQRAITVTANAQPNITSVGTLTSLGVTGFTNIQSNAQVTGNLAVFGSITRNASPVVALNDFQLSAGGSGSSTLPNGLTMKWGSFSFSSGASFVTVNFPSAFQNNAFQVFLTLRSNPDTSDESDEYFWVSGISPGQFTVSASGDRSNVTIAYFAIGN